MESYHGLIVTPSDAILLLEAARQSVIPKMNRRLSDYERMILIKPGAVFIWNESESNMKRWTDSRNWSASRVNAAFLIYRELDSSQTTSTSYAYKRNGLVKQSFSVTMKSGGKVHLISYMNSDHEANRYLMRPTQDPRLRHIQIDRSLYPDNLLVDESDKKQEKASLLRRASDTTYDKQKTLVAPAHLPPINNVDMGPTFSSTNIVASTDRVPRSSTDQQKTQFRYSGRLQEDGKMLSVLDRYFK
ncbi:hypothetical protein KL921_001946 [Ogataea angusta]|uniref:cAMP-independent regulatory protein pac2 n=1 Tax=Pichia angusta TaxID=870730 RepID=A0AAN6I630_PICAN|nr:uncharacterized protein KL928_002130 [Ogataea angusta]KAG7811680.1 hypothetical protein KL921_001946 [Ogataea angusta]KAG7819456.1 hypothetical protein KL928_002130 [Ogataea angusta]KAG7824236.1 hypothetical protein KL909_002234 [Ogataea angusta]KAG7830971.1 hypothetical protein KL920_001562 [Ogataea angusta]KAG7835192.1 hypothetical protein KL943_002507 [Ogataea angusta]